MFEVDFFSQAPDNITQLATEKLVSGCEDWEKQIWEFIAGWFNKSIDSVSVYTSGSTGAPKKITHTKTAILNSAAATCAALQLKPGNRALLCLPVNKISGIMMVVRSIYNKMHMICIKPSSTPLQQLPEDANLDFAAFTPMQLTAIINSPEVLKKAGAIKKLILGGEDVRPELLPAIQQLHNDTYITFGMTETISHIALKKLNGKTPDTYFKTLPGINITTDARDCLVIQAPALNQPYLVTNDVVKQIHENEFEWLGRIDNVINSGGVKIHPEEIEKQLLQSMHIPYFITSVPDMITGEKVALAIEKNTLTSDDKREISEAIGKLEKLHKPKQILLIPGFVRTENGKIKRKESQHMAIDFIDV